MDYTRTNTYPESRLDENKMTATMFLNKVIGTGSFDQDGNPTINGADFAAEMFDLSNYGFNVTVDINSNGGGVVPGYSIFDAVVRTKSDTRIVGLAASMAAGIAQAGKRRYMNDIGSLMLHGISPNGTEEQMMDILNAQLRGILETRTKLGKKRIDEIFESGQDEFFAVVGVPKNRHALKMGLIDEVIATGLSMPVERLEEPENRNILVAAYNQILSPKREDDNQKSSKVENNFLQVKAALGLDPEASEASMLKKVQDLEKEASGATALKAANETLTAENKGLQESRVNSLLTEAKSVGYPEDQLDGLKTFAEANFEGATNLVVGLKASGSLSEENGVGAAGGANGATAQNLSLGAQAQAASGSKEKKDEGKLLTYDEYMSTAENEAKFFALSEADQNKVLDANQLSKGINAGD